MNDQTRAHFGVLLDATHAAEQDGDPLYPIWHSGHTLAAELTMVIADEQCAATETAAHHVAQLADYARQWLAERIAASNPPAEPRSAGSVDLGAVSGTVSAEPRSLSWDWREGPDLDELTAVLADLGVTVRQIDTGSDQYEIELSRQQATPPPPETDGPILGPVKIDRDGDVWRDRGDTLWASGALARPLEEVEAVYGPLTDAVLVTPAAARVVQLAQRWERSEVAARLREDAADGGWVSADPEEFAAAEALQVAVRAVNAGTPPPAPSDQASGGRPWTDADRELVASHISTRAPHDAAGDILNALADAGRIADPYQQPGGAVIAAHSALHDEAQEEIARLRAEADTARRDGAADGIMFARDHVPYDSREVLASLARQVRDGLTVPTAPPAETDTLSATEEPAVGRE